MKKILITLAFCVFAYVYSIYFTGLQAESLADKTQQLKNVSSSNCAEQNFCAISRDSETTLSDMKK